MKFMSKRNFRNKPSPAGQGTYGGSADSILSTVFNNLLVPLGLHIGANFSSYLERYVSNPMNGVPQNIREKSSARGNLRKELLKPTMTWKVFMKGLRFLEVKFVKITFEVHYSNNKTHVVTCPIKLGDFVDSETGDVDISVMDREEMTKIHETMNARIATKDKGKLP